MAKTSVDGTTYMLDLVEGHLERQEAHLADLLSCTQLDIEVGYGKSEKIGTGRHVEYVKKTMKVTLKASDMYTTDYSDGENHSFPSTAYTLPDGTKGFKSFEEERKSQVYKTESRIKGIKADITFFKTKIAEFKEIA